LIDTKALRSRILDLAIQGKLTEQLPGESVDTADISLLSESPYSIPKNWKWTTIQNIISKDVGGGTPSKSVSEYWKNGDIPWMSVKDFSSAKNGVLDDTIDHITQAGLDNSSSNLVDEEAIIICMRMALGKIVKINKPMAINQDLRAIWLKSFIDNNYFVYFYSTLKVEGHGMTVAGISKAQLMSYPFSLPPLAEQKRIVERVEEIFRLLDTIDKAQEKYSADSQILKAKLITAGIRGKLTKQLPSDGSAQELYQQIQAEKQKHISAIKPEDIPFEIPCNWKWVKLGEIVTILGGKRIPAGRSLTTENTGHKYIRVSDMKNMSVETSNLLYVPEDIYPSISRYIINKEDVYITVAGTIGRVGTIPDEIDGANLTENADRLVFTLLDKKWLVFCLSSDAVQKQISYLTIQVAQPKLAIKKIQEFCIPLPPLAEQKRIADVLERALGVFE